MGSATRVRWWAAGRDTVHDALSSVVDQLIDDNFGRFETAASCAAMYGETELLGSDVHGKPLTIASQLQGGTDFLTQLRYNLIKTVEDALHSQVAAQRPRPLPLTTGGSASEQKRAKLLGKFILGVLLEQKGYPESDNVLLDGLTYGSGCMKVFGDASTGKIKLERVTYPTVELLVDKQDAKYGKPRCLYQVLSCDRYVLADRFGANETLRRRIMSADNISEGSDVGIDDSRTPTDMVRVIEAWHLPSGPEKKDGRHVICVSSGSIFDEVWDKDYHPFSFFHASGKLSGFWGKGVPQEIGALQVEINRLVRTNAKALKYHGVPILMVDGVGKLEMSNEFGQVIKTNGGKIELFVPQVLSNESISQIEAHWQRGFEVYGLNQSFAQGMKPAGLTSGEAQRVTLDIQNSRLSQMLKGWEEFFVDLGKLIINEARCLYENGVDVEVRAPGKRFLETIKWSEVDLEDDMYVLQMFPVNLLPTQPAARIERVQEMLQLGIIQPEQAAGLLDFPDLEESASFSQSSPQLIAELIEHFEDSDEYISPEPFMNLALAKKSFQEAYVRGKIRKLPEQRLASMRQFLADIAYLEKQAMPPPAAMGGMPGAPPPMTGDPSLAGLPPGMEDMGLMDALPPDEAALDPSLAGLPL